MKNYFPLILTLASLLFFFSCEEDNEVIINSNAKLIWTGEFDIDGCGFFIEIDSVAYKPENEGIISPTYKTAEPLNITVQYIDLLYDLEYVCGDSPETKSSPAIKLTSMDVQDNP